MKFSTNKEIGNTALGIAISYFSAKGYTISIPLNDTQDYDLVIEEEGKFKSVQVKGTSCLTKYGNYQVALKSCGGTRGTTGNNIFFNLCKKKYSKVVGNIIRNVPKNKFKNIVKKYLI